MAAATPPHPARLHSPRTPHPIRTPRPAPPRPPRAVQSTVLMVSAPTRFTDFVGSNFGDESAPDYSLWTDSEKLVVGFVGDYQCAATSRYHATVTSPPEVRCYLEANTTCGYQSITVVAAGQEGFSPSVPHDSAVLVACAYGYFARLGEACVPCPALGAVCSGYNEDLDDFAARFTYPNATAGWYNLNGSYNALTGVGTPCPDTQLRGCCPSVYQNASDPLRDYCATNQMAACPAAFQYTNPLTGAEDRDVCIVPCSPASACLGDNHCAEGYMSKAPMYRCASCALHYYARAGSCIKCPDSPYALVIGFILIVIAAVGLGVFLNKRGVNVAVISIGVDYFQVGARAHVRVCVCVRAEWRLADAADTCSRSHVEGRADAAFTAANRTVPRLPSPCRSSPSSRTPRCSGPSPFSSCSRSCPPST